MSVEALNYNSKIFFEEDQRSCGMKLVDLIISIFRHALYSVKFAYQKRTMKNRQYCEQNIQWSPQSKGLVVLLHGLNSDPAVWHSQLSLLSKETEISTFAPVVPNRGMCSLSAAAAPILPTVLDYIAKNPQKPVCILGFSNGSRIATWLETRLRYQAPLAPVMVSTIAGVHLGSHRVDLMNTCRLPNYFFPETLRSELTYNNPYAIELLNAVRAPLPLHCAPRKYEFYATTEDILVPDLDSSLPQIHKGERHYVVHGQSHGSLVSAIAQKQIASSVEWIKNSC
jgi:hypothetical protein